MSGGELVQQTIPGELTETSLKLPPGLPRERWVEVGRTLRAMERGVQWWVGDWLAYGEEAYGEEAFAELGRADKTLANWASVARKVPPSRRRDAVRFSHHAEVAPLPPAEQEELLEEIERENLTVGQTRERVEARRRAAEEETHGPAQTVDTPECPTCGAAPDHWKRVPEGVKGREGDGRED